MPTLRQTVRAGNGWQAVALMLLPISVCSIRSRRVISSPPGYVRRWVPELARVDDKSLFAPFDADPMLAVAAGLQPGKTYPLPLVAHPEGRARALAAFEVVKANK